jgi:peptide/nickel transport system ATP-binding protein
VTTTEKRSGLSVEGLRIALEGRPHDIVDEVSFEIAPGEVLGIVGESGSGKTTAGLGLLGHTRRGAEITDGSVRIGETQVLKLNRDALRHLRGRVISYVPQDPAASLNPALRVGTQMLEVLEEHDFGSSGKERRERVAEMMREVALPDDDAYLRRYPHQLSGGQQQRIGLAMAFACRPAVIVLDEPTTGLDVTTQARVLQTVRELAALHGTAAVYVSHDLAVIGTLADRVAVMYAGRIVELGRVQELFHDAAHPYTRRLTEAIPHLHGAKRLVGIPGRAPSPGSRPQGCHFAPRCEFVIDACREKLPELRPLEGERRVRCIRAEEVRASGSARVAGAADEPANAGGDAVLSIRNLSAGYSGTQILHGISIDLAPRECLALVGESGSGKTTLSRTIAGLHRERTGDILFRGEPLELSARDRKPVVRQSVQYIFQNPYGSLNPRRSVGDIVRQPLEIFGSGGKEADRKVGDMLERVSLTAAYAQKYPDQLSGGERQRVAIARALVCEPTVLVCDEITSALDVSVQAAIVDLLAALQRDFGLSMLFVTHNLPLVRSIAQRVAVMNKGRIVEMGTVDQVMQDPQDSYTRNLLEHTPSLETVNV